MMISDLQQRLEAIVVDPDEGYGVAAQLVEELESTSDSFEAVGPIIRLLESNPDFDFGAPGPLVHFVESFYGKGYEDLLLQSVLRSPTSHTLWMINRIANGTNGTLKAQLTTLLKQTTERTDVDDSITERAERYAKLHV